MNSIEHYIGDNVKKRRTNRFSTRYGAAVAKIDCDYVDFVPGDKPTVSIQQPCDLTHAIGSSSLSKAATIDFSGVIKDMHSFSNEISKLNSHSTRSRRKKKGQAKRDDFVTEFDVDNKTNAAFYFSPTNVFEPLFHPIKVNSMDTSKNGFCDYVSSLLVSSSAPVDIEFNDLCSLQHLFDADPVHDAIHQCQYYDQQLDWYDRTDINSIHINRSYESVGNSFVSSTDGQDGFYESTDRTQQGSDDDTVLHCNINKVNMENPSLYHMYDVPCAQMDGGAKCTVTGSLHLLKKVKWYDKRFPCKVRMKGATSTNIIIPKAEGFLQVPTIERQMD